MNLLDRVRNLISRPRSRREKLLDINSAEVKNKLGKSFFRGTITPATRYRRVARLTPQERLLAYNKGWIN